MRKYFQKVNFRYIAFPLMSILLLFLFSFLNSSYAYIDLGDEGEFDPEVQNYQRQLDEYKRLPRDLYQLFLPLIQNDQNATPTPVPDQSNQPGTPLTPTSIIPIGPVPSDTEITRFIDRIVSAVHNSCISGGIRGIVTNMNRDCLNVLRNGLMNEPGINEMKASATNYRYVQCVACARAMAVATDKKYNGFGNAKQHAGLRVPGYTYYSRSTAQNRVVPGSLYILTGGTYGHIGYVSEVYRDASGRAHSFKAFECNYQRNGYVSHEKIWPYDRVSGFQIPDTT